MIHFGKKRSKESIDLHTEEQLRMYFMLALGKRQTNIELYNICRPVKDISIIIAKIIFEDSRIFFYLSSNVLFVMRIPVTNLFPV